jgi:hypothetical protein
MTTPNHAGMDDARKQSHRALLAAAIARRNAYIDTATDNGRKDPASWPEYDERVSDFNTEIAYLADVYINTVS